MRNSLFHVDCVCHLVVYNCSSPLFMPLQSLSDLVPLLTWALKQGAQRHLSLKCGVNTTATHMGRPLEQHFHLLLESSLCPTTQVSVQGDDVAFLKVTHTALCSCANKIKHL